jgi:predicted MFS family arabinose efflux permease
MRRSSWSVALHGLLALACAMGIGRFAFTPILPMMQKETGLAMEHAGWIASANYLGYFAGALWTMVQRAHPRRAIRLALVATTLSTLAMAYTEGLPAWLALRFIAGVASAWALVYVASWCIERLSVLGKPSLNGIVFAGVGVGIILAGGLCLVVMAFGAGAREAWLSLGGVALACTVLAWPVLGVTGGDAAQPAQAPKVRSSPDAMHLVACYGAFGFAYIVPATFIPAMARQAIADPIVFGWAWPVFGAAAGISTLTAGALSRAFGNRTVWIACALTMAAGVAAPLVVPGLAGILACAVLVGSTFVAITMVGIQEARLVAKESASALVAAMTAAFAAGQVVGPLAVSAVGGFTAALALAAAALLASAALLRFSAFRPRSKSQA